MECNKDDAIRAKEVAERKFSSKDFAGAKKFALKAQTLYPGLDGASQMVATFDVYISAENKISGESDWYGILGVNPHADDDTLRKQYRKLALTLHPDKNKAIGADGAFKLVSEAYSVLSDKAKRSTFDQKRYANLYRKVSTASFKAYKSASSTTTTTSATRTTFASRSSSSSARTMHTESHNSEPATFWTLCHGCKMQYEYLKIYVNHNLLCPNCRQPFLAVEITPPVLNCPPIRFGFVSR